MRVSNGEIPKWRITSIKDKNGFHTDHGERAANDLFGKILSLDKDDVYYSINYNGLMFNVYKSNVKIEDAIRYIHSDVERLQMITSYIPVNLFEKTIQDELLCRCDL